jgi:hypothetical protein
MMGSWSANKSHKIELFTITTAAATGDDRADGVAIIITVVNCSACCWHNGTATISADGHHITNLLAHAASSASSVGSSSSGCTVTGSGEVSENSVLEYIDVDYSYDHIVGYEIKWAIEVDGRHGGWPTMAHSTSALRTRKGVL